MKVLLLYITLSVIGTVTVVDNLPFPSIKHEREFSQFRDSHLQAHRKVIPLPARLVKQEATWNFRRRKRNHNFEDGIAMETQRSHSSIE